MTMIDNRQGFGAAIGNGDLGNDYAKTRIELSDNKIYGESEIPDCPDDGSFCFNFDKYGVMLTGGTHLAKGFHVTGSHTLPHQKVKSLPNWGTLQQMYRNEFIGFKSKTKTGMR